MTERKFGNRILGIDPGLNITGYGVIDINGRQVELVEAGVVRSKRNQSLENRLLQIYDGINDLLQSFQPDCVSLEQVFSHYTRPQTAILMGHARGVINLAVAQAKLVVNSYQPTQVKSVLTGNGRASKSQVQLAVTQHFNLREPPTPHDISDALAIALCHAFLGQSDTALSALNS